MTSISAISVSSVQGVQHHVGFKLFKAWQYSHSHSRYTYWAVKSSYYHHPRWRTVARFLRFPVCVFVCTVLFSHWFNYFHFRNTLYRKKKSACLMLTDALPGIDISGPPILSLEATSSSIEILLKFQWNLRTLTLYGSAVSEFLYSCSYKAVHSYFYLFIFVFYFFQKVFFQKSHYTTTSWLYCKIRFTGIGQISKYVKYIPWSPITCKLWVHISFCWWYISK